MSAIGNNLTISQISGAIDAATDRQLPSPLRGLIAEYTMIQQIANKLSDDLICVRKEIGEYQTFDGFYGTTYHQLWNDRFFQSPTFHPLRKLRAKEAELQKQLAALPAENIQAATARTNRVWTWIEWGTPITLISGVAAFILTGAIAQVQYSSTAGLLFTNSWLGFSWWKGERAGRAIGEFFNPAATK